MRVRMQSSGGRTLLLSSGLGLVLAAGIALGLGSPAWSGNTRAQGSISGSFGDRNDAYMSFVISGGSSFKLRPGYNNYYDGNWDGGPITISGEMTVTRSEGAVSYVSMSAYIDTKSWKWPPAGQDGKVTGKTVTQHYKLTYTVPKGAPGPISGSATLNVCGGVCGTFQVQFTLSIKPGTKPQPTKPTTTPKKPPRAVDYPNIHARQVAKPWPLHPGTNVWLPYTMEDKSGKAKMRGTLYEGGTPLFDWATKYALPADGRTLTWRIHLASGLKGPLRVCLWSENAAGKKSVFAPKSSCVYLAMLVDIKRVSNGCGGEGWDSLVWVENYFGNIHSYKDSNVNPLAKNYTVNFIDACDLHDAGYGGMTVRDKINDRVIDFHDWTRKQVDNMFWVDMKKLCDSQIGKQEPKGVTATVALAKCKGVGGKASIGSQWLYNKVRYWGNHFFDADLTRPGVQQSGDRDNS